MRPRYAEGPGYREEIDWRSFCLNVNQDGSDLPAAWKRFNAAATEHFGGQPFVVDDVARYNHPTAEGGAIMVVIFVTDAKAIRLAYSAPEPLRENIFTNDIGK